MGYLCGAFLVFIAMAWAVEWRHINTEVFNEK